ncbi:MAG: ATP synthase F0 subunit B [Bdellovibrionales bacterium]|nr:ATP synthase F0 subunit B [Bdellovibrionales bacterium]
MDHSAAASISTLFWPAVNLSILVGTIFYTTREQRKSFVKDRHFKLRDEVENVSRQLKEAQVKYNEFSAKMKAIEAEVEAIRDQAQGDAEFMKAKVLSEAKRLATAIVSDAKTSTDGLFQDLRSDLRTDMANWVIDRAEGILRDRLTADDRAKIRSEFSQQLGASR